jgi:hypothetical protein
VQLHSYSLGFKHPVTSEALELRAPLPQDMLTMAGFMLRARPEQGGDVEEKRGVLIALRDGQPLP